MGSKVKIKVLRTLLKYPSKKFTVRELAKLAEVSHTPVLKSLADLQRMNLISLEKHGTANLLALNVKSHLYSALQELFAFEKETKTALEQKIRQTLPPVKMAILFGSVQKGNEGLGSDIDLLIVAKDKNEVKNIEKRLEDYRVKIIEMFGNLLSPIILTEEEFKKKKSKPFAEDLVKDYKLIKGEDLVKKWWGMENK